MAKFTHKIEVPENIIEGDIYFKREEYNEDGIKVKELDFLEIDISKNISRKVFFKIGKIR